MWNRDKLKLWSSEIVALTSIVPWLFITFFTERFQAYIRIVYVDSWTHIQSTMSVYRISGWLFIFTVVSLIIGGFQQFKV